MQRVRGRGSCVLEVEVVCERSSREDGKVIHSTGVWAKRVDEKLVMPHLKQVHGMVGEKK